MRRTFDELETLAYIQGREVVFLEMVRQHLADLDETNGQDLQRLEREVEAALADKAKAEADLEFALGRISSLEHSLREIHRLSTPPG